MRNGSLITFVALSALLGGFAANAQAQITTFTDEASFLAGAGSVSFESFEGVAPSLRASTPISVSLFTVTPAPGLIGIQNGPNSPETGFSAFAVDGANYLFAYRPNLPAGTLRFDFSNPTTAFGFYMTDNGETDGAVTLQTNAGDAAAGITAKSFPPLLGNGSVFFFGFTQATPFTQLLLTSTGIDDSFGLDKIYAQAVPEPGALILSVSGLAGGLGIGIRLLRRRARRFLSAHPGRAKGAR